MATEDDLKRGGQAAAALVGVAAARAKQIAEQLLGPRVKEQHDGRSKADAFVQEGKHAAAEVVGALRREATVIIEDLERLERALRGRGEASAARGASTATGRATAATRVKQAPVKKAAVKKAAVKKAAGKKAAGAKRQSGSARPAEGRA